jgi:hypothetical protein
MKTKGTAKPRSRVTQEFLKSQLMMVLKNDFTVRRFS